MSSSTGSHNHVIYLSTCLRFVIIIPQVCNFPSSVLRLIMLPVSAQGDWRETAGCSH